MKDFKWKSCPASYVLKETCVLFYTALCYVKVIQFRRRHQQGTVLFKSFQSLSIKQHTDSSRWPDVWSHQAIIISVTISLTWPSTSDSASVTFTLSEDNIYFFSDERFTVSKLFSFNYVLNLTEVILHTLSVKKD